LSYTRPRCVLTVELEMPRAVAVSGTPPTWTMAALAK
jgi:hypothetical protein